MVVSTLGAASANGAAAVVVALEVGTAVVDPAVGLAGEADDAIAGRTVPPAKARVGAASERGGVASADAAGTVDGGATGVAGSDGAAAAASRPAVRPADAGAFGAAGG